MLMSANNDATPPVARARGPRSLSPSATRLAAALILLLLTALSCAAAPPQAGRDTYCNPLDVIIADPFVLRANNTYYLYGTTVAQYGLQAFSSHDLIDWRNHGFVIHRTGTSWARNHYWA